ncbi:hypothetical protein ACZ90_48760 [Streptomyces albus subsp. albus]|nr:hypothetical protein ACZ90_48760 [Streptomyces albus subsp. albus]
MSIDLRTDPGTGLDPQPGTGWDHGRDVDRETGGAADREIEPGGTDPGGEGERFANLLAVYVDSLTMPHGLDEGHAGGCG